MVRCARRRATEEDCKRLFWARQDDGKVLYVRETPKKLTCGAVIDDAVFRSVSTWSSRTSFEPQIGSSFLGFYIRVRIMDSINTSALRPRALSARPDIHLFKDEKCIKLDLLIMPSITSSITHYMSKDPRRRHTPLWIRHPATGRTSRSP